MAGMDENKPYLPERYRQKIREKNRRRAAVRILTITHILVVIAVLVFSLSGLSWAGLPAAPFSPASRPAPPTGVVTTVSLDSQAKIPSQGTTRTSLPPAPPAAAPRVAGYTIGPGVPQQEGSGSLTLVQAEAALRRYCPEDMFTISSVNYSAGSARSLFGFTLRQTGGQAPQEDLVVFINAATGMPWSAGEDTTVFPKEMVAEVVLGEFPHEDISSPGIWYDNSPREGDIWRFTLASGNMTLVSGAVDATYGEIRKFSRNIPAFGRPAAPAITKETAQGIAGRYVTDRNSGLSLVLTSSRYDRWGTESVPAAGAYTFFFERRHLDYPVDTDGISVVVDALTGEVIGYDKQWTTPEYAFSQAVVPTIARHEATYAAIEAARAVYPEQIGSVRILSSELRWNNGQMKGTIPRPGSVPLAWKIVFDDEILRTNASLASRIVWIDIQTGNVTVIEYRH
ncbi:YcdB/YcdC domain-containing protein [Methanoregula sp.]|uniref:YcdB/YcdC domain-containing protein n=1 Tax=Methanoregula sp. TaxID=2052170 RepID=UPI00261D61C2|nr:YcdB/YcdC domain-containing protein [Methanoregula sp.]MDD5143038.1 hypothetical protein [Methanoregula sp.]